MAPTKKRTLRRSKTSKKCGLGKRRNRTTKKCRCQKVCKVM